MEVEMNEVKMNEVMLAGRIASDLNHLPDDSVHFLIDVLEEDKPIHCFCRNETAKNILKFCEKGDEVSCDGNLTRYKFINEKEPQLLVQVRYISYGRKQRTLR